MYKKTGADHIITLDLHDPQYQGFFDCTVDNLSAFPIMIKYIQQHIYDYKDIVLVSPDAGGAKRYNSIPLFLAAAAAAAAASLLYLIKKQNQTD